MESAPLPDNEAQRIAELLKYRILDTESEQIFDELTALAAEICGTPISLISILDNKRQWFKSHHGLDAQETPREYAFCEHAILEDDVFVVEDSHKDSRFADNPLVTGDPHVRFYAGTQLNVASGHNLGTLCVIDHEPRELSESQQKALQIIGRQIISQLELRKHLHDLQNRSDELEQFAYTLGHDLKSPAIAVNMLSQMLEEDLTKNARDKIQDDIQHIQVNCRYMMNLIDGVIKYIKLDDSDIEFETVHIKAMIDELSQVVNSDKNVKIIYHTEIPEFKTQKLLLQQVFSNLLSNAVKHNDKSQCEISISCKMHPNQIEFLVSDNGPGISDSEKENVFRLFYTSNRNKNTNCTGVGLALVKKIVTSHGGQIDVVSKPNQGASFKFTWPISEDGNID